jgi:hypothetical protein
MNVRTMSTRDLIAELATLELVRTAPAFVTEWRSSELWSDRHQIVLRQLDIIHALRQRRARVR